jgi:DNA modification methylase
MENYKKFLESKKISHIESGFDCGDLHEKLFAFQKAIVKWALKRGRSAIFADTGLGKTFQQVVWADEVVKHTNGNVLIFAPLCVAYQTKDLAKSELNIDVNYCRSQDKVASGINITNYEMLDHFDASKFSGIVLDEASIIKSYDGKTTDKILDFSKNIPYKLSCTATPSPNDYMELGNQAEFVGVMSRTEMLAMFFIHDGGDTAKWRLKGHGEIKFWEWLSTWAVVVRKPSDLGFDDTGYILPELIMHEHIIESNDPIEGQLFNLPAIGLNEQRSAKRASLNERVYAVAELVNESDDPWMVWCHLNDESEALGKAIKDSVTVAGSDSIDHKESSMTGFSNGKIKRLISKASICGYGMNWQHCNHTAFAGIDNSFKSMYQAIRRFYRFGQTRPVNVHLFLSDAEIPVLDNIKRKEKQHNEMSARMVEHMQEFMKKEIFGMMPEKSEYKRQVVKEEKYELHLADCVELASEIESGSIDYTVFSPPFASLYTYSNSDRDMGNSKSTSEFYQHFKFLVDEMLRITRPGRLLSFHCMNLPTSKQNDGFIGIKDFRGDLIKMFVDAGWIYHSEVVIWKDPVTAMQRTKALGLLHKTIRKDSSMSRQGIPDYLVTMRKPGINDKPIAHTKEEFPVDLWQRYASPVWFDINPSKTLQFRSAREGDDERHICPLQLEVIERAIELWTAKNDLVFSPFTGIGSEGYTAIKMGRGFIGSELKESYFNLAKKNLEFSTKQEPQLDLSNQDEENDNI